MRAFRYRAGAEPVIRYYDETFDLDSVQTAWFVITRFSKRWRAPAHTFVSFGFSGGRYLAVSVEARKERHESYSIVRGLFRQYELIYVMGDELDLIGRRTLLEDDDTWLYPVRADRGAIREVLVAMVRRANQLIGEPEFYNSLFNSCASNLVRHVNEIAPGRIPGGWKVLAPGYNDDVARRLGLIAEGHRINDKARRASDLGGPAFSRAIRAN